MQVKIGEFPRIDFGGPPPPRNGTKLFTDLLQPTFKEGTDSFVSGGPYRPKGEPPLKMEQNSLYWTLIANL